VEGGRSRSDRENVLPLHSPPDDFAKGLDAQTLAEYQSCSEKAKAVIRSLTLRYAKSLIRTSASVRDRRSGADVSEANVTVADHILSQPEKQESRGVGGIWGGLLLGTGLSTLASMIQNSEYTPGGTIVTSLTMSLGAFLVARSLPRSQGERKSKSGQEPRPMVTRRKGQRPSRS
jgi:hypothetical protein